MLLLLTLNYWLFFIILGSFTIGTITTGLFLIDPYQFSIESKNIYKRIGFSCLFVSVIAIIIRIIVYMNFGV